MAYTLDRLAREIGQALKEHPGQAGRERARAVLEAALRDDRFRAAIFGPERTKPREVLYEDAESGFCICAHVYAGGADGKPHDHGPTWAIYGQAEGVTEMTDWRVVAPARDGLPARVEPVRTYRLEPGAAHLYDVGAVHSPRRAGPTKLVRVEGRNLDTVSRTPIEAVQPQSA